jgi:Zn-dependent peptidase ImmA (M78 family)/predicted secreted protein
LNSRQVHVTAIKAAARAHQLFEVNIDQQVDPFEAIGRAGVTVAIVPLANLSGAYLPAMPETDGRPGILVNAKHPRTRQRYTAAHELCHHLRDGDLILDEETEVLPRSENVRNHTEAVAEAFAGWFLMPRRLVDRYIRELGITEPARPEDVYRLSLALGTSYLATAAHLFSLGKLNRANWSRLAKLPPKWIKQQIAVHGPGDSWGDVWHITDREPALQRITPRPGDEIVIELDELPSSGYMWTEPKGTGFELAESTFEQNETGGKLDPIVGGQGRRRVVLRATEPGEYRLDMVMRRPWLQSDAAVKEFSLQLSVQRPLIGYARLAEAV